MPCRPDAVGCVRALCRARQITTAVLLAERVPESCKLRNEADETPLHVLARTPRLLTGGTPQRRAIGGGAVVPGDDDSAEAEMIRRLVRTLCGVDGVDMEAVRFP